MGRTKLPFTAGSTIMISGPTSSGKTYWVKRLIKENMFTETIASVLYCYGVYQKSYEEFEDNNKIQLHEGLPTLEQIQTLNDRKFHVIVIDDLMESVICNKKMEELFTKLSHHYKCSTIFITQNIFAQGSCSRNISLNSHVLVIFANKRDESQANTLARQVFPNATKAFLEAYEDATNEAYGYLVVDCTPTTPRDFKLRTNIFPNEITYCYIPK